VTSHSPEYLSEMLAQVKEHVPDWLYAELRSAARPRAGGRASWRVDEPTTLERIALDGLGAESLRLVEDDDLRGLWGRLDRWYAGRRRRREELEPIVAPASVVLAEFQRRKLSVPSSPLVEATAELEQVTKGDVDLVKGKPDLGPCGPFRAPVAFVEASLDPIEKARQEHLVGPVGACFRETYLAPLGLRKEDVAFLSLVPQLLKGLDGQRRDPRPAEVALWRDGQVELLKQLDPLVTVALGRVVGQELADVVDVTLPHPAAVHRLGDHGEVARKMKRVGSMIAERSRAFVALSRTLQKAEGETVSDQAVEEWAENWIDRIPPTGKGRFVYQHHWRGLSEDEVADSDAALLRTDRSLHGDLRLEGPKGCWGWTIFLGAAARNLDGDRLLDVGEKDRIEVTPKLEHPEEWLEVGFSRPFVAEPGTAGAPAETYSKFFGIDSGTYEIGVVRDGLVELRLDGKRLNGVYLISLAQIGDRARWLIAKPKNQTPIAERADLPDLLGELRSKKEKHLVWGTPGARPSFLDVATGEEIRKSETWVDIAKADEEKRIVYGCVADPYGEHGPTPDADNDWPTPAGVENAAHAFAAGKRTIGFNHRSKADAEMVESWVEQYPSRKDYLAAHDSPPRPHRVYRRRFGDDVAHSGSWWMAVRLSPELWQMFKAGDLNGFSIGGHGVRVPMTDAEFPQVTFVDIEERPKR